MFAAGLLISLIAFFTAMEWHIGGGDDDDDWDDDIVMDLNLKPDDQRDMISAAQKMEPKIEKESENLNKVDEATEIPPEILDKVKFTIEEDEEDIKLKEDEKEEDPINLNDKEDEELVNNLPMFPGGMVEFMKWLTANLKYPQSAMRRKIQGMVMASFIVNADGTISNLKIVKKVNPELDREALRVLQSMPKWEPGKEKGKNCRAMVAIPVVFAL